MLASTHKSVILPNQNWFFNYNHAVLVLNLRAACTCILIKQ